MITKLQSIDPERLGKEEGGAWIFLGGRNKINFWDRFGAGVGWIREFRCGKDGMEEKLELGNFG